MKKNLLVLIIVLIMTQVVRGQLDFSSMRVDVGVNYTMYKGGFGEKTPGLKLRLSVPDNEKIAIGLGFTYGFPIKQPSVVEYSGGSFVPSEIVYNFKTISLEFDYYFGGEKEEGLSVYGSGRAGFVLVNYKEKLLGTAPPGEEPVDQVEPGNLNGFTLNGAIGTQYSLGALKIFADAGVAIPANQVNGQFVENIIPAHFMFNLGVRFSLGAGHNQ